MNEIRMRDKIDEVLAELEAVALEDRIAPVKCEKNPDAPECQPQALYGIQPEYGVDPNDPVVRYGVGF